MLCRNELVRILKSIRSDKEAAGLRSNGVVDACRQLLQRESTPDSVRGLAGSLITLATNTPVVSNIADVHSGGYGHVNSALVQIWYVWFCSHCTTGFENLQLEH